MLFIYKATTKDGGEQAGNIDAPNMDIAIAALQRRGLIVISISPEAKEGFLSRSVPFLSKVKNKDVVILSRQIATLFEAKVSVLQTFRLLASESPNPKLQQALTEVTDDIKGGMPISEAMAKQPEVFSSFYVDMVKSGEESGKLSETFNYLADHLERSYELTSKAQNALIYPIFVIFSFVVVMALMMIYVIPKLSQILLENGQEIPIYTKIVIGTSNLMVNFGPVLLVLLVVLTAFMWKYVATPRGRTMTSQFKLAIPYVGDLYQKLYLSRIADNLNTMLTSGISMVRALEITADVVGNDVYHSILIEAAATIRQGGAVADSFSKYPEIPPIMIQMMKVGEETGKLGFVLETMARFYRREVNNAVDTLVGMIEPVMIVVLGVGVGVLLTAVLVPIYNIAASI
jgi:type IV pilus assembly protein PilC